MLYIKNKILFLFQLILISLNYLFNKNFNEKKIIQENLSNEAIVFDIGSNLGSYIKFVSICGKKKKIKFHSFEPSFNSCNTQQKLSLKKGHSLVINNKAVTDENKNVKFYERSISSHSSLIDSPKMSAISKTIEKYDVDSTTIESYCDNNNIEKIDLMKIDAEGYDYRVLKSSEKLLLEKRIKLIKIEIWTEDDSLALISSYLNDLGYVFIGATNLSYLNNRIKFFDAYFLSG